MGGVAQISTDKYSRVVYAIAVDLKRALDLSALGVSKAGEEVRRACLVENNLTTSMDLPASRKQKAYKGLLFASVIGGDDNLVVYRANCSRKALTIQNEQQVIDQAKRIAAKHR